MDRPLTYNEATTLNIVQAAERFDELTHREMSARLAANLKAGGKFDADNHGHQILAQAEPLSTDDHLELMAVGEVMARYYRHPTMLDHAAKAGATWEQIGAAGGSSTDQARQDYREWAEGQHNLRTYGSGRFGTTDQEYAEALARLDGPETEAGQ